MMTSKSASPALPQPSFRAGLVQMCTGRNVAASLETAARLIRSAVAQGATYVQTPEVTTLMEMDRTRLFAAISQEDGNPAVTYFSELARELGIWLHIGSMAIQVEPEKIANRGMLFTPDGGITARYDKIHMFDVELPGGERYRESRNYRPGDTAVVATLPWGKLGITICYDMRFPTLYRALAHAGAEIIAVPSAFTVPTGTAHWHALLRARAIETQCFVLAAAQAGEHESGRKTYGHSIAISPWGEIIAEGDQTSECVILADIDMSKVSEARQKVPSLTHDRPFQVVSDVKDTRTPSRQA